MTTRESFADEGTSMPAKQDPSVASPGTGGRMDDAARNANLDRTRIVVEPSAFDELAAMIDAPASNEVMDRLLNAPMPWNEDDPTERP